VLTGLLVWRAHVRLPLLPLGACYVHWLVQAGLLPAPRSEFEWGGSAVALGFALLAGSLAASYRFRSCRPEEVHRNASTRTTNPAQEDAALASADAANARVRGEAGIAGGTRSSRARPPMSRRGSRSRSTEANDSALPQLERRTRTAPVGTASAWLLDFTRKGL
jgi:hypothetical protein